MEEDSISDQLKILAKILLFISAIWSCIILFYIAWSVADFFFK